jgi:hypothetical protein
MLILPKNRFYFKENEWKAASQVSVIERLVYNPLEKCLGERRPWWRGDFFCSAILGVKDFFPVDPKKVSRRRSSCKTMNRFVLRRSLSMILCF